MARLTREQSQALTREKLLAAAYEIVGRDGYSGATIDRIAETAGFSKGAFYSNFSSKEDIYLQLLERNARGDIVELSSLLRDQPDADSLIETLGDWASRRASDQRWGIFAMELMRLALREDTFGARHLELFREQWEGLGEIIIERLLPNGQPSVSPFMLGGIVLELTYCGVSSFMSPEAPGEMVKLVLRSMHRANAAQAVVPQSSRKAIKQRRKMAPSLANASV